MANSRYYCSGIVWIPRLPPLPHPPFISHLYMSSTACRKCRSKTATRWYRTNELIPTKEKESLINSFDDSPNAPSRSNSNMSQNVLHRLEWCSLQQQPVWIYVHYYSPFWSPDVISRNKRGNLFLIYFNQDMLFSKATQCGVYLHENRDAQGNLTYSFYAQTLCMDLTIQIDSANTLRREH